METYEDPESWKRAGAIRVGDHWTIREDDAEDGWSVIECYVQGSTRPIRDLHVPDHLIGPLIEALHERLNEIE